MNRKLHIMILESHGRSRKSLLYKEVELKPGESLEIILYSNGISQKGIAKVENIVKKGDG